MSSDNGKSKPRKRRKVVMVGGAPNRKKKPKAKKPKNGITRAV